MFDAVEAVVKRGASGRSVGGAREAAELCIAFATLRRGSSSFWWRVGYGLGHGGKGTALKCLASGTMCKVVEGFGRVGRRDAGVCSAAVEAAVGRLRSFKTGDIRRLIWGLTTLGHTSSKVLRPLPGIVIECVAFHGD
jgi:hypothetical protein